MSHELVFWDQTHDVVTPPRQIYEKLSDGEAVEGLEEIPVDKFLAAIRKKFRGTQENPGTLDWESKDRGAFQVTWSPQHVRVDCYGMSGEEMNKLIDIAGDFDCPLYDPQIDTRFF